MKRMKRILAIMIIAILSFMMFPVVTQAAEHIKADTPASFSVVCTKPGYTFTVYQVATLDSNDSTPYSLKYNNKVDAIADGVLNGKTSDILAALDAIETMPSEASVMGTFDTTELSTKVFTNLPHGIYYIKATNFPAGVKDVTNSVVALPYYNQGTGTWVYDMPNIELGTKVIDEGATTTKTITNSTKGNVNYTDVSLGDVVNFEIKSTTAGSLTMKLGSYTVYDNMSKGLTLDKNSFSVSLLKSDGTTITTLDKSEYEVNVTSENAGENTLFHVDFNSDYLQTDEFYSADVFYTSITYSAALNEYAVTGTAGNPNTDVKLEFSNKNGVKSEVAGNTVYVYTYAITANKYNEKNEPLEGAEFALFATMEDASNIDLDKAIATGRSNADGVIEFDKTKLQSGTYYAVEIKAPADYTIYGKVITIDLKAEYNDTFVNETWVKTCQPNGVAHFEVMNTKSVISSTGGEGRRSIYIFGIGLAIVGLSFFGFYTAKKHCDKKNKNNEQ